MTEASVGIAAVPEAVAARKASSSNASTSASSTAAATLATNQQQQASALVHTAIGAVAGVVEVSIMQPTVAIKNALQVRRVCSTVQRDVGIQLLLLLPELVPSVLLKLQASSKLGA